MKVTASSILKKHLERDPDFACVISERKGEIICDIIPRSPEGALMYQRVLSDAVDGIFRKSDTIKVEMRANEEINPYSKIGN